MRHERVITLAGLGDVRVREARVADLRALLDALPDAAAPDWSPLVWVRTNLPMLLALLGDGIALPAGKTPADLSLSELDAIVTAWWAMHADFFGRALALLGLQIAPDASAPPPTSTPPSPPSAPAASPPPGTGAGATSPACSS